MANVIKETRKKYGLYLDEYDAGSVDITDDYLAEDIVPENVLATLLVYVTENSFIKLNDEDEEIFLPKEIWTPIGIVVIKFNIKTDTADNAKVHWQGWY